MPSRTKTAKPSDAYSMNDQFAAIVAGLMARTEAAYMRPLWGDAQWEKTIEMLLRMEFNPREVEAIMASKWARWASDAYSTSRGTPKMMREYLKSVEATGALRREVAELVAEHFGPADPLDQIAAILNQEAATAVDDVDKVRQIIEVVRATGRKVGGR